MTGLGLAPDDAYVCTADYIPLEPSIFKERSGIALEQCKIPMKVRDFEAKVEALADDMPGVAKIGLGLGFDEVIEVKVEEKDNGRRIAVVKHLTLKKAETPPWTPVKKGMKKGARKKAEGPTGEVGPEEEI